MPGTLVSDALATGANALYTGTISSATTTNGTATELIHPRWVQFILDTGTLTGTGQGRVSIQGADDSGFTTNVVSYAAFPEISESDDDVVFETTGYVDSRYIRAQIITEGTPSSWALSVEAHEPHYKRVPGTTSAD